MGKVTQISFSLDFDWPEQVDMPGSESGGMTWGEFELVTSEEVDRAQPIVYWIWARTVIHDWVQATMIWSP